MNEEKRSELLSYFLNEEYGVLPSFSDVHVYYEVVDEERDVTPPLDLICSCRQSRRESSFFFVTAPLVKLAKRKSIRTATSKVRFIP